MELICEKYQEKMVEAQAECAHLTEYCKFRSACVINFLTRERQRESRQGEDAAETPVASVPQRDI